MVRVPRILSRRAHVFTSAKIYILLVIYSSTLVGSNLVFNLVQPLCASFESCAFGIDRVVAINWLLKGNLLYIMLAIAVLLYVIPVILIVLNSPFVLAELFVIFDCDMCFTSSTIYRVLSDLPTTKQRCA